MQAVTDAYYAEILVRLKRQRTPAEIRMEHLPKIGCGWVSAREEYCVYEYGHLGPCSWRKKK